MNLEATRQWIEERRDLALEILRVYVGLALFAKGISFIGEMQALQETARAAPGFSADLLAHYVVIAHLAGGLMLALGFITRAAAAIQIPPVLGAVLFVHMKEGLFTAGMGLELTVLVLFLLALFTFVGGGRWSVDGWMAAHARPMEAPASVHH